MTGTDDRVRRSAGLAIAGCYLVSPLVWQFALGDGKAARDALFLFSVVASGLWMAIAYLGVRRLAWLHLCLLPLYVTTAIDLFLLGTFGTRLSSGYVTIALTDYSDFSEFLSAYARGTSVSALVLLAVYLGGYRLLRASTKPRSVRWACVALAVLVGVYGFAIVRGIRQGLDVQRAVLDLAGHEHSAPVGVVFQSALALHLNAVNGELRQRRSGYSFGASRVAPIDDEEIYVWIVGESSRPENWSLFGYSRDTTPRLRAQPDIIALPNMLTTAPHTAVAVPSMLSLRPISNWSAVQAEKSVVTAFNEVGFKTYWLSAQDADSWAGAIPEVAAEAKRRRYFDRDFDGALLREVTDILQDTAKGSKTFIVLHTKGSHFDYARRYPEDFARFDTAHPNRRQHIVDTYDNSVLYTDWLVSEVIAELGRRNGRSAVIFASDHGENLLDDDRQLLGHALGTTFDLRTAALLWVSPKMRAASAQQMDNAARNAAAPLSLSNLPHSLLDLAGIKAANLDPSQSIFSATFAVRPRDYMLRGELLHESASKP